MGGGGGGVGESSSRMPTGKMPIGGNEEIKHCTKSNFSEETQGFGHHYMSLSKAKYW